MAWVKGQPGEHLSDAPPVVHWLKVEVAGRAIIAAGFKAAVLKSAARSRMGMDRCGRAFRSVPCRRERPVGRV